MKKVSVLYFVMLLCIGMLTGCRSEVAPVSSNRSSSETSLPVSEPSQSSEESEGTSEETQAESENTSEDTSAAMTNMTTDISTEELTTIQETESSTTSPPPPPPTETAPAVEEQTSEGYVIRNFPMILQMPELPTGCEITAMTMALQYYGYNVDKITMTTEYLPIVPANLHYGEDGRLYGNDLRKYFVGNPFTDAGYICGTEAILTAANGYLEEVGGSLRAVDKTGTSPEELYELVRKNTPVVVWVTEKMENRKTLRGWYTEDGTYVDWTTNDHGAVLIGYSESTVTIADPLAGIVEYSRTRFEKVFASRSYQCVVLE